MAERPVRHPSIDPGHPGELLDAIVIPATGKSKTEIARLLGISRQTLYDVLAGRQSVTPSLAMRLGKLFGNGPGLWLRMQVEHDLWKAEREMKDQIAKIPTLKVA